MKRRAAFIIAFGVALACAGQSIRRIPLPCGFHPSAIAAADFNGDGHADLAVAGESRRLIILLGDGRGGLRAAPESGRAGLSPAAMVAADLNGDGRIDLVVANHDSDHLSVLIGDGTGRFTAREVRVHSNPHPHMVAAADVDSDGRVDLITDSFMENNLTLVKADGRGGWVSPGNPIAVGRKPYYTLVAADLDGDGHADLVTPNYGRGTVSILFGDGHGHFVHAPQSPLAAGPEPFSATVADVNGDGRPDVIVANYSGHIQDTAQDGVTWIRNDGRRRFTPLPERIMIGHGSARIAAGDFDGDGFNDAAFTNSAGSEVAVAFGSRSGLRAGVTLPAVPGPHALVMVDLDGDRRAEIAVVTEERDEVAVIPGRAMARPH